MRVVLFRIPPKDWRGHGDEGRKRLWVLAAANFVIGVVAAGLAFIPLGDPFGLASLLPPFGLRDLLIVPLFASTLCQAVLLALWASCSRASPWVRLAGLIVGAAYLESLLAAKLGHEFVGLGSVTIAATTAALLVVRALGVRLTRGTAPI